MKIRLEQPSDFATIHALHVEAFGGGGEAKLVDLLRLQAAPLVSLVAAVDHQVVGHVAFSPMQPLGNGSQLMMGLAPLGVLPGWQRKGVGAGLVREGLAQCRARGAKAVFVLGQAEYYPRFGFVAASRFGIRCEYEAPDECFMALELEPGSLEGVSGAVKYHPAFAELF